MVGHSQLESEVLNAAEAASPDTPAAPPEVSESEVDEEEDAGDIPRSLTAAAAQQQQGGQKRRRSSTHDSTNEAAKVCMSLPCLLAALVTIIISTTEFGTTLVHLRPVLRVPQCVLHGSECCFMCIASSCPGLVSCAETAI